MKQDEDSKLIAEAYNEGVMSALGSAGKAVGKAGLKSGLAVGGAGAKGAGIALDGIMKALNYLTSEQLQKLGQAALDKADEIRISDEEGC